MNQNEITKKLNLNEEKVTQIIIVGIFGLSLLFGGILSDKHITAKWMSINGYGIGLSIVLAFMANIYFKLKNKEVSEIAKIVIKTSSKLAVGFLLMMFVAPILGAMILGMLGLDENVVTIILPYFLAFFVYKSLKNTCVEWKQANKQKKIFMESLGLTNHQVLEVGNKLLAVDNKTRKIIIIDNLPLAISKKGQDEIKVFSYRDVVSVEIVENENVISRTHTSRANQVLTTAVGGILLGGVGAIIGGVTAKKVTKNEAKVNKIELRIIMNDIEKPLYSFRLLSIETKRDSSAYRRAMDEALHWHGIFKTLIHSAEAEDKELAKQAISIQENKPQQLVPQSSIADEIAKLNSLKDSGAITIDEYESLKKKLITNG